MTLRAGAEGRDPAGRLDVREFRMVRRGDLVAVANHEDDSGHAGGNALHMRAINEVKKAGCIRALVDSGRIRNGIMHALTASGTP